MERGPLHPLRPAGAGGPALGDEALVGKSREVLIEAEALGFMGEGYRKVWARLPFAVIPTSKERVRRLMREHGLQVPRWPGHPRGSYVHNGTIIPDHSRYP